VAKPVKVLGIISGNEGTMPPEDALLELGKIACSAGAVLRVYKQNLDFTNRIHMVSSMCSSVHYILFLLCTDTFVL
jgi:hypothetical protein